MPRPVPDRVGRVVSLDLAVMESYPEQIRVTVRAEVPTAGYTNPRLVPVVYVKAPSDGVWDYTFAADPPEGPAAQVITTLEASTVRVRSADLRGIRVGGLERLLD